MALPKMMAGAELIWLGVAFLGAFLFALLSIRLLIPRLLERSAVARESARTLHKGAVPVGGGWAIVPPVFLALVLFSPPGWEMGALVIAGGLLFLALLSWADDRHYLPAGLRFAAQILAVTAALAVLPGDMVVFSRQWPLWADRVLTGFCWLWFINLFNFMDGIDSLAGVETLFITGGLLLIALVLGHDPASLLPLAVLAGAVSGFLYYNWPPARIFLGDVGSIPLGFVLGWLLIRLAGEGYLAAALLLPGYFLADATLTLLWRMLRGEAFWRPHRTHLYQRAALAMNSHARVLWRIIPANVALLFLALLSLRWPLPALAAGVVVIGVLLFALKRVASAIGK